VGWPGPTPGGTREEMGFRGRSRDTDEKEKGCWVEGTQKHPVRRERGKQRLGKAAKKKRCAPMTEAEEGGRD